MQNLGEILLERLDHENLWEKEFTVERNEFLKSAGTTDLNIYYVAEGCFRVFIVDEFEEATIRFGYQHNFIAALDSALMGVPSDLCIQALRKSHVKVVRKATLEQFLRHSFDLMELWIRFMEVLVCQQLERERDLLINSPQERYQRVLKRSPQLFQEVPSKYIASYLRMTPETLSRLKKS